MAVDKLVDSTQLDSDLTSVANAIRTKGGTSAQLAFPSGFVTAIGNIPTGGGGSGLTLLKTTALGALSTSATSSTDTGKTLTLTGYNDYDLLLVDISVDTATNGRHTSTVSIIFLTGTSDVGTKNTYSVIGPRWNSKLSSTGTGSTRYATSGYGVYINGVTVSGSTMTFTVYYRYSSTSSGTINGSYTARIYGVKLYDLIGG